MSSLNTRWVVLYFASNRNALWFAKSSNCIIYPSENERWCQKKGQQQKNPPLSGAYDANVMNFCCQTEKACTVVTGVLLHFLFDNSFISLLSENATFVPSQQSHCHGKLRKTCPWGVSSSLCPNSTTQELGLKRIHCKSEDQWWPPHRSKVSFNNNWISLLSTILGKEIEIKMHTWTRTFSP